MDYDDMIITALLNCNSNDWHRGECGGWTGRRSKAHCVCSTARVSWQAVLILYHRWTRTVDCVETVINSNILMNEIESCSNQPPQRAHLAFG